MRGYVPGEQPPPGKFIKLNTNENPYPPSPAVVRAIVEAAERGLARYPDPHGHRLSHPRGGRAGRATRLDSCAATAATTS